MIQRTQTPPPHKDYRRFKPYLRIDFLYRCAYCGITEYRWGSERNFVVEHFRPRCLFAHLATTYSNLYYACNKCNDCKSDTWPSDEETLLGYSWFDPCAQEPDDHFRQLADGSLVPRSPQGDYTIDNLQLNLRTYLVTWRRERSQLLADIDASLRLIEQLRSTKDLSHAVRRRLAILLDSHRRLCEALKRQY